ncbi:T-cell surface glycoprotein CD8 beta chain-like [Tachysurus fulvidraco]|uniref:T-cell surface glycoprotein CD8 beta chain-like n=1 Tax=Tachysurus fulvidraco TaxID=1234273 RepID=UPI001FEF9B71|nr:T-cell surface glycoprotein CD8 beta chain-like [Tachysurus fulvidraco]
MIRLFVALCALFSLFTAVKTSDIKEIDVITVKRGEDVTMKCNISSDTKKENVGWYRQISGKLPQYFAKSYKYTDKLGYKFIEGFNDARFSISVNDSKFDLSMKQTREDDEGEYFCGEMEGSKVDFTSGTRLQFEDKETTHSNTTKTTQRSNKTGEHNWINPLLASNIFSVIVITLLLGVLYKNHRKDASSSNHQIPTNQTAAAADDVLNYAAVSFAKKPSSSRTSRAKSHEDVYAQVKIK